MKNKIERRTFKIALKRSADGDAEAASRTLSGYAALFNSLSEDMGGWREQIAPGAFDDCLDDDIRCLFNHDPNFVLGRTKSGTCRVRSDDTGLAFECDLPDTDAADDLVESMNRGDIDQCSFAFTVADNGATWTEQADRTYIRTVNKCSQLFDVSAVTYPAYSDTSCDIRSTAEILIEARTAGQLAPPVASGDGVGLSPSDLRRITDFSVSF